MLLFCIPYSYSQNQIKLTSKRNKDNSVDIHFSKDMPGTYCIYLNFSNYENTLTPKRKFIVEDYNGFLYSLKPIDRTKFINYTYSYNYKRGIPNPKTDTAFVYLLPFRNNSPVEVRFLNNLGAKYFDKEEPKNWKAFQFICHKADTICSVRKGIVIRVVDNFSIDTTKVFSYSSSRNLIMIEHPDGTFARYEGFDNKNIFVKQGDIVLPNQALGTLIQYDKSGVYQLRFAIDYLTENRSDDKEKQRSSYDYLDPYFQTTEGVQKLALRKTYITKTSDDLIIKELSRKDQKKRQKN